MSLSEQPLILGVTGSIAAYKSPQLVRLLRDRGFDVHVAMTSAARKYVGPLTFEALTGQPVYSDPTSIPARRAESQSTAKSGIVHTDLSENAAAMIVAPATANSLAKLAGGFANDPISVVALAMNQNAPLIIAPAMNPRMWHHPAVQENVERLKNRGALIVGPGSGSTACGDLGTGRMAEPEEIAAAAVRAIAARRTSSLRVLILSGPTREPIDDVRFVSNGSSGRMGAALASAVYESGDDVTVISGPAPFMPAPWIKTIRVESAEEMLNAAKSEKWDVLLSPAAIADYRPEERITGKPSKQASLTLNLVNTPDVLTSLEHGGGTIVAFAAEESVEKLEKARSKGERKGARYIALNKATEAMNAETNRIVLIDTESGDHHDFGPAPKVRVARDLWLHLRTTFADGQL